MLKYYNYQHKTASIRTTYQNFSYICTRNKERNYGAQRKPTCGVRARFVWISADL